MMVRRRVRPGSGTLMDPLTRRAWMSTVLRWGRTVMVPTGPRRFPVVKTVSSLMAMVSVPASSRSAWKRNGVPARR